MKFVTPRHVAMVAFSVASSCAAPAGAGEPEAPRTVELSSAVCPDARYPRVANQAGVRGKTRLSFVVDAAGKVSDVQIQEKSGETQAHALLDAEALRVMRSCRFPPSPGFGPATAAQNFLFVHDVR